MTVVDSWECLSVGGVILHIIRGGDKQPIVIPIPGPKEVLKLADFEGWFLCSGVSSSASFKDKYLLQILSNFNEQYII